MEEKEYDKLMKYQMLTQSWLFFWAGTVLLIIGIAGIVILLKFLGF